jgi:hypothetical protein
VTGVGLAKATLALLGLGAFMWGAGRDIAWARWAGLALLLAAWLLRFRERGERHPKDHGPSM